MNRVQDPRIEMEDLGMGVPAFSAAVQPERARDCGPFCPDDSGRGSGDVSGG
jgi:hypothetical protein